MSMQEFSDNLSTLSYVQKSRLPQWLYDSKNGTYMGRTLLQWGLLFIFYVTYYLSLSAFFGGLLWVFLNGFIEDDKPVLTGLHSMLDLRPGLGYRPVIDAKQSLIHFTSSDPQSYYLYTENIDAFLDYYNAINSKPEGQFGDCSNSARDLDKTCKYPLTVLGDCNSANNYGYPDGTPCVLLKLNKIFGWLPEIVNHSVFPHTLINCSGQNPADVDNIGELQYFPEYDDNGVKYGYFNSNYYPFIGQAGYLSPLVAVKFNSPTKRVLILVQCKLINLKNAYQTELEFELLVD